MIEQKTQIGWLGWGGVGWAGGRERQIQSEEEEEEEEEKRKETHGIMKKTQRFTVMMITVHMANGELCDGSLVRV